MMESPETGRTPDARIDDPTTKNPPRKDPPMQEKVEEKKTPGNQKRPMTKEEEVDVALDDTFPASDPISPSRIDGPKN